MQEYSTIEYSDQSIGKQLNSEVIILKFNSKIFSVFLALIAIVMIISTVSAVDLANDFGIDVPSETNFNETVNINTDNINFVIFENSGNNSTDVNSIMYFKDLTASKNEINDIIEDLNDDWEKIEENDKYIVFKTSENFNDFDIPNGFDTISNFVSDIFSVGDGLNISADGNSVSFSDEGLEVHSADGENVSVSSEGISVSGNSSDNESVNISGDLDSNIGFSDYYIFLKNNDGDEVIVLFGNNLESLKSIAETVSFNEN